MRKTPVFSSRGARRRADSVWATAALLALLGCSPELNWREVRPAQAGVKLLFPCKPRTESRPLTLAGAQLSMTMTACETGGVTYALAHADVTDPSRVAPALREMRDAWAAKLGGARRLGDWRPPGATPGVESGRWRLEARLPDGQPLHQEIGYFSHGTRVFQAAVVGPRAAPEASATFFDAIQAEP